MLRSLDEPAEPEHSPEFPVAVTVQCHPDRIVPSPNGIIVFVQFFPASPVSLDNRQNLFELSHIVFRWIEPVCSLTVRIRYVFHLVKSQNLDSRLFLSFECSDIFEILLVVADSFPVLDLPSEGGIFVKECLEPVPIVAVEGLECGFDDTLRAAGPAEKKPPATASKRGDACPTDEKRSPPQTDSVGIVWISRISWLIWTAGGAARWST